MLVLACAASLPGPAQAQDPAASTVSGRVSDSAGQPLADSTATLFDAGCTNACEARASARTDPDGRYTVAVAPGRYVVRFAAPTTRHATLWFEQARTRGDARAITVVTGAVVTDVDAQLPDAGALSGRVRRPDGTPLADAVVSAGDAVGRTNEDGNYVLRALAPGPYTVTVAPVDAALERAEVPVTVTAGTQRLDVRVEAAALPVERLAGDGRAATAVAVSQRGWPDGADTVVIAAGGTFPDALAAAPLAVAHDAPLLVVDTRTPLLVLDEIRRLRARHAIIVGAVGAVPLVVQAELARAGLSVERIAGEARFDTAALVSASTRAVREPHPVVFVAAGRAFPDALAGAPVAAHLGAPVLLSEQEDLTQDTAAAVADSGARRAIVLGGVGAVSEDAVDDLPPVQRLAGSDRYATSTTIAEYALEHGGRLDTVYVATGENFPDALAAGPLAGRSGEVLLLVDGDDPEGASSVYTFLAERFADIERVVLLGGLAAISEDVAERVRRPAGATP